MKTTRHWLPAVPILLAATPALAVDTSRTYHSGILIVGFLAFCALILVVQLLPSLMMLFGWIKGLARGKSVADEQEKVEVR